MTLLGSSPSPASFLSILWMLFMYPPLVKHSESLVSCKLVNLWHLLQSSDFDVFRCELGPFLVQELSNYINGIFSIQCNRWWTLHGGITLQNILFRFHSSLFMPKWNSSTVKSLVFMVTIAPTWTATMDCFSLVNMLYCRTESVTWCYLNRTLA